MKYHNVEQNSDEWFALRLGKFTASTFKDLFAKDTTIAYQKAINKVVFEVLTGTSPESFSNDYMQRGHDLEPLARQAYEGEKICTVDNGGFWEMDEWTGASPDGLVGDDGLLEIKCPAYNTQIEYLLRQKLPSEYFYQVHGQMLVTGRQWCDFVSFHPALPMVILRIERSEEVCKQISEKLREAVDIATGKIEKIRKL